jgi:hypothetical protein
MIKVNPRHFRTCLFLKAFVADAIYDHKKRLKAGILMRLASNRPMYQVPDSPNDALDMVLKLLMDVQPADRLETLKGYLEDMATTSTRRLMTTVANTTLMMELLNVRRYTTLWTEGGFTCHQLYQWRSAISPVGDLRTTVNDGAR